MSSWVSGGLWRVGCRAQGLILEDTDCTKNAQPWTEVPLCSCYSHWWEASTPAYASSFTSPWHSGPTVLLPTGAAPAKGVSPHDPCRRVGLAGLLVTLPQSLSNVHQKEGLGTALTPDHSPPPSPEREKQTRESGCSRAKNSGFRPSIASYLRQLPVPSPVRWGC